MNAGWIETEVYPSSNDINTNLQNYKKHAGEPETKTKWLTTWPINEFDESLPINKRKAE